MHCGARGAALSRVRGAARVSSRCPRAPPGFGPSHRVSAGDTASWRPSETAPPRGGLGPPWLTPLPPCPWTRSPLTSPARLSVCPSRQRGACPSGRRGGRVGGRAAAGSLHARSSLGFPASARPAFLSESLSVAGRRRGLSSGAQAKGGLRPLDMPWGGAAAASCPAGGRAGRRAWAGPVLPRQGGRGGLLPPGVSFLAARRCPWSRKTQVNSRRSPG